MTKGYITKDNPGKGDCGFYSFAIGLMPYLQQELLTHPTGLGPLMTKLLKGCSEEKWGITKESIKNYNFSQPNNEFLMELNVALRKALRHYRLECIKTALKKDKEVKINYIILNPNENLSSQAINQHTRGNINHNEYLLFLTAEKKIHALTSLTYTDKKITVKQEAFRKSQGEILLTAALSLNTQSVERNKIYTGSIYSGVFDTITGLSHLESHSTRHTQSIRVIGDALAVLHSLVEYPNQGQTTHTELFENDAFFKETLKFKKLNKESIRKYKTAKNPDKKILWEEITQKFIIYLTKELTIPNEDTTNILDQLVLKNKEQVGTWATSEDLSELAEYFNVNLTLYSNNTPVPGNINSSQPSIQIRNTLFGLHWDTLLKPFLNYQFSSKSQEQSLLQLAKKCYCSYALSVLEIEKLFTSYIATSPFGDNSMSRFLGGMWNRHHVNSARDIIAKCHEPNMSVSELLTFINDKFRSITVNPHGELQRRLDYLSFRQNSTEDPSPTPSTSSSTPLPMTR